MHWSAWLGHGDAQGLRDDLGDVVMACGQAGFGDRREQGVVVDQHLDAPAEQVAVQVAGDGNQRRAIEKRAADAGGEIGRAGPEGGDAQPRSPAHAAGDIGGERRRSFMRGEHEFDAALAHRLNERQHIAARDAESMGDSGVLQRSELFNCVLLCADRNRTNMMQTNAGRGEQALILYAYSWTGHWLRAVLILNGLPTGCAPVGVQRWACSTSWPMGMHEWVSNTRCAEVRGPIGVRQWVSANLP